MGAWLGVGIANSVTEKPTVTESATELSQPTEIDFGIDKIRGFTFDNVLHSETDGDIHFGLYIPKGYDGSELYALFITLPGYEGLYFQGVGAGIRAEDFGMEA